MIERSRRRRSAALRNGTIDVAIAAGETPLLDVQTMLLWRERIVIALPEGHRLTSDGTVHATDLRGETHLMTLQDPGSAIQNLLATSSTAPDDRPRIVHHDVSRGSIKCLVDAGFGIRLMSESFIGANFTRLVCRVAHDDNVEIRIADCAHWREDNNDPAWLVF